MLCVTGLHEEVPEEDLVDAFSEYGEVKNCVLSRDLRTGYLKGYGLLEYQDCKEAQKTIEYFDNKDFMGKIIRVDWAFKKPPRK